MISTSIVLFLMSCNQYEFFNVAGYEQATFSNDADILFVIDNSASMWQEASALGQNFNVFINQLATQSGSEGAVHGLNDAVNDYISYVTKRGNFIDYQLAITTTSVDYTGAGSSSALEPGEAGLLTGSPTILGRDNPDVATAFKKNLLCSTTYWDEVELLKPENQDPNYDCDAGGDPEFISVQYLDCLCGVDQWTSPAGSGQEEPLEAALMALCRAEENPPDVCYQLSDPVCSKNACIIDNTVMTDITNAQNCGTCIDGNGEQLSSYENRNDCEVNDNTWISGQFGNHTEEQCDLIKQAYPNVSWDFTPSVFGTNDVGTNGGFLRDGSTVVIAILGDEGDTSRRIPNGSDDVTTYLDAFAQFDRNIKFVAFGPDLVLDDDGVGYSLPCNNGGSTDWAAARLLHMTEETRGFYSSLEEEDGANCVPSDFSVHLERLGVLLNNLDTSFRLATIPDVTSIQVYVDGEIIDPSPVLTSNPDGTPLTYGAGWSYESADNAVTFWGDPITNPQKLDDGCCIPDYNSDVRIYYRPLAGKPRELPFLVE